MDSTRAGVALAHLRQDFVGHLAIELVENLRHGAQAAGGFALDLAQRLQLARDHRRDLVHHHRRNLIQARQPDGDFAAQFGRHRTQHGGRLARAQMRQNQRDGLRMLAFDETGEQLRIQPLQALAGIGAAARCFGQPLHVFLAAFGAECGGQNALGEIHAAVTLAGMRRGGSEFLQNRFGLFAGNGRQTGDGGRDRLNFVVAQTLEQLRGSLIAHGDQQNRGFLNAGKYGSVRGSGHGLGLLLAEPSAQHPGADLSVLLRGLANLVGQHFDPGRSERGQRRSSQRRGRPGVGRGCSAGRAAGSAPAAGRDSGWRACAGSR